LHTNKSRYDGANEWMNDWV